MSDVHAATTPTGPRLAAPPAITLDRSRTFSEVRGERGPDDPLYRVHYFQTYKVGNKRVQLPFDSQGDLVPDDGKTEPFQGIADGKPVTFQPLYDADMRRLVAQLAEKMARPVAQEPGAGEPVIDGAAIDASDTVNLAAWLRGQVRYEPHELRAACKQRYHKQYTDIGEMVRELVLDERLVPEAELSAEFKRYLPAS